MNQIVQFQPPRLPYADAIGDRFGVDKAGWKALTEAIFPSARSPDSIVMALSYCKARKLDVFKKPVHIVPMWDSSKQGYVETVWPGIAEIRTTAARTGNYAGIDEVEFGPIVEREFTGRVKVSGNWQDKTMTVRYPEWARVTVYRNVEGVRCAFRARIFWEETYATAGKSDLPNEMWAKRPRGQLDKCVEAAALRKAFPEELGNVYAAEEMEGQAVIDKPAPPSPPPPPPPPEEKPEVEDAVFEPAEPEPEQSSAPQPARAATQAAPEKTEKAPPPPPASGAAKQNEDTRFKIDGAGAVWDLKNGSKVPPHFITTAGESGFTIGDGYYKWLEQKAEHEAKQKGDAVSTKAPPPPPPPQAAEPTSHGDDPIDPEEFMQEMEARMKDAPTEDDVIAVWLEMSPEDILDFPPDLEAAQRIYEKQRERFQ